MTGLALHVKFCGQSRGCVLRRTDADGNLLAREEDGSYHICSRPPPIPENLVRLQPKKNAMPALCCKDRIEADVMPLFEHQVQKGGDVYFEIEPVHILMLIKTVLLYTYQVRKGVGIVELLVAYPRKYGERLKRQMSLRARNLLSVAQEHVADKVLLRANGRSLEYSVIGIEVFNESAEQIQLKLRIESEGRVSRRQQSAVIRSSDLSCSFFLQGGRRKFLKKEIC